MGWTIDGIYSIQPVTGSCTHTWCDMTNGGWTVIQRRMDGSEDFYRTWTDYVRGFGNRAAEYWIGLENIVGLTADESVLKIELESFGDVSPISANATYQEFKVDNETSKFRLHVNGFSGTCGDGLRYHNGSLFTTKLNCAQRYKGGWWYKSCHSSNLNGPYLPGNHTSYADGIDWIPCWGFYYSVRSSVMKVRRNKET